MICENCGKEHNGLYGSGRFCSKECARSYSRKTIDSTKLKEVKCKECGKIYKRSIHSIDEIICEECYKKIKSIKNKLNFTYKTSGVKLKNYKYCWVCGKYECNNDICKLLKTSDIRNLIKYFNFDKNTLGTSKALDEYNRIKLELYTLYFVEKKPCAELEIKYNYPSHINQNIFPIFGFKGRNLKEAGKISYECGRHDISITTNFKHGWHTTWNNKEVYYRSQNELDYAIELDNQQIDYEMEILRIKYFDTRLNEYRCAIPDFYIPSKNEIVEIKSAYTLDIQNMKDKEKEYLKLGYKFKIILDNISYNSVYDIDLNKYNIIDNIHLKPKRIYKQTEGYYWIYKDNIQLRCNKNELNKYIELGWNNGRLLYK